MKKVAVAVLALVLLGSGCGDPHPVGAGNAAILRIGMEFEAAESILEKSGAKPTALQIVPKQSPDGKYLQLACYGLERKPAIIINYEPVNGKNIIRTLSLYYEYENKGDPNNRWLEVEAIDLNNIGS